MQKACGKQKLVSIVFTIDPFNFSALWDTLQHGLFMLVALVYVNCLPYKIQYPCYLWKWILAVENINNEYYCTEYNQKDCIANWEYGHKILPVCITRRKK